MNIDDYLSLLNEKHQVLTEIYDYTKSKTFKKSEDEIERIEYYLSNRQNMYDKLSIIEKNIKKLNVNNIDNKEVINIINKNDEIINNILKLDEEKKEIMEFILNLLKNNIKSVKSMAKINNSYLGTYENTVGGSLFDSSK